MSRARRGIAPGAMLALAGLWCGQATAAVPLQAQDAKADRATDSAFVLSSDDPGRLPSPFIGNGHLGLVVPPLGIGGSLSLLAGLYDRAPGDVPRIAAVPAWNGIEVFDGERWLPATPAADGSVAGYRQAVDMRTGTAAPPSPPSDSISLRTTRAACGCGSRWRRGRRATGSPSER